MPGKNLKIPKPVAKATDAVTCKPKIEECFVASIVPGKSYTYWLLRLEGKEGEKHTPRVSKEVADALDSETVYTFVLDYMVDKDGKRATSSVVRDILHKGESLGLIKNEKK